MSGTANMLHMDLKTQSHSQRQTERHVSRGPVWTSHTGGGLCLLGVAGGCGYGLPRQSVHGSQELVSDASGLPEPAEKCAVDGGGVIPDGVLAGEEQTWNRLKEAGGKKQLQSRWEKGIIGEMKAQWWSRTRNDRVSCFVHKPLQALRVL